MSQVCSCLKTRTSLHHSCSGCPVVHLTACVRRRTEPRRGLGRRWRAPSRCRILSTAGRQRFVTGSRGWAITHGTADIYGPVRQALLLVGAQLLPLGRFRGIQTILLETGTDLRGYTGDPRLRILADTPDDCMTIEGSLRGFNMAYLSPFSDIDAGATCHRRGLVLVPETSSSKAWIMSRIGSFDGHIPGHVSGLVVSQAIEII